MRFKLPGRPHGENLRARTKVFQRIHGYVRSIDLAVPTDILCPKLPQGLFGICISLDKDTHKGTLILHEQLEVPFFAHLSDVFPGNFCFLEGSELRAQLVTGVGPGGAKERKN
jgi:hypothetical protein